MPMLARGLFVDLFLPTGKVHFGFLRVYYPVPTRIERSVQRFTVTKACEVVEKVVIRHHAFAQIKRQNNLLITRQLANTLERIKLTHVETPKVRSLKRLGCEDLAVVVKGFELQRITAVIVEEHSTLLAGFTFKTNIRFDNKLDTRSFNSLSQCFPVVAP